MCVLLHLLIYTVLRAHVIVVEALYNIRYYNYSLFSNTALLRTKSDCIQQWTYYKYNPTEIVPVRRLAVCENDDDWLRIGTTTVTGGQTVGADELKSFSCVGGSGLKRHLSKRSEN